MKLFTMLALMFAAQIALGENAEVTTNPEALCTHTAASLTVAGVKLGDTVDKIPKDKDTNDTGYDPSGVGIVVKKDVAMFYYDKSKTVVKIGVYMPLVLKTKIGEPRNTETVWGKADKVYVTHEHFDGGRFTKLRFHYLDRNIVVIWYSVKETNGTEDNRGVVELSK